MSTFWKVVVKTFIRVALLLIPLGMSLLPKEWLNITLGTALVFVFEWAKLKYSTL